MTEAEIAALKAAGERIKKPFRASKDTGELVRDRDVYLARKATITTLLQLGNAAQYLDEAIGDLLVGKIETEADKELANLWQCVCELFPGITLPSGTVV